LASREGCNGTIGGDCARTNIRPYRRRARAILCRVDKHTYAMVIPRDGERFHMVRQFAIRGACGVVGSSAGAPTQGRSTRYHRTGRPAVERGRETGCAQGDNGLPRDTDVARDEHSQRGWVFLADGNPEGEHDRENEEQDMHSEWFSRDDSWWTGDQGSDITRRTVHWPECGNKLLLAES